MAMSKRSGTRIFSVLIVGGVLVVLLGVLVLVVAADPVVKTVGSIAATCVAVAMFLLAAGVRGANRRL